MLSINVLAVYMPIVISPAICAKLLSKHQVKPEEVEQCFANRNGEYIEEVRQEHQTNPPTWWFIAETHYGRKLKVVFVHDNGNNYIRSAFPPNEATIKNYIKNGGRTI